MCGASLDDWVLMAVLLMFFSRMVSMVLVLRKGSPILDNGYEI